MRRSRTRWCGAQVVVTVVVLGLATGVGAQAARAVESSAPWAVPIKKADSALGRGEFSAALKAVNEAYAAALSDKNWEGLVAVGDAYRRIGEASGLHQSFDAKARAVYLKAVFRARQEASVDGVLRGAEGFVGLGDREMVARCLRIAEILAAQDPDAKADVRAFAARVGDPALRAQGLHR